MTKAEKEKKIKLISLILLCQYEIGRKNEFKGPFEFLSCIIETSRWVIELQKVLQISTFKPDGKYIEEKGKEIFINN